MFSSKLSIFLLLLLHSLASVECVPFVTKRVSLHNPIHIDFSGWRPLRPPPHHHHDTMQVSDSTQHHMTSSSSSSHVSPIEPMSDENGPPPNTGAAADIASLDNHFLTVPVAVETDAEHVLSETDLNQIREHVITNWNQKAVKTEAFPHLSSFVTKLMPKPEIELKEQIREQIRAETQLQTQEEVLGDGGGGGGGGGGGETEYTFVKMDKNLLLNPNSNSTDENLFHAYFAPKDHIPPDGYVRLTKSEFRQLFKSAEIVFI